MTENVSKLYLEDYEKLLLFYRNWWERYIRMKPHKHWCNYWEQVSADVLQFLLFIKTVWKTPPPTIKSVKHTITNPSFISSFVNFWLLRVYFIKVILFFGHPSNIYSIIYLLISLFFTLNFFAYYFYPWCNNLFPCPQCFVQLGKFTALAIRKWFQRRE